jgi:hypothetical protein
MAHGYYETRDVNSKAVLLVNGAVAGIFALFLALLYYAWHKKNESAQFHPPLDPPALFKMEAAPKRGLSK